MKRKHPKQASPRPVFARTVLGTAIALAVGTAVPAYAFEFSSANGEVTGSFDTTVSAGALWRMEGREKSLISIANGGTSRDPNSDDGNLRYSNGELVSAVVKATHDLELNYRNFGAFVRASYFYDDAVMNKSGLSSDARDQAGRDAEILDAYVRGAFDVGGRNLNLRLGKQVVSWGESTFILNGINVLNPINVSRLRIPGSELKEGLIPTGMLWASQEITDNLSAEFVWMAEWEKTKIDPVGTFFSTNDFVAEGGANAYTGFGRRNDGNAALGTFPSAVFPLDRTAPLIAPRAKDEEPGGGDEYGLAFRAFFPELNNTEFGLFHANYHSRTPFVSGIRGGLTALRTTLNGATVSSCTVLDVPTFNSNFNPAVPATAILATNLACATANGRAGNYFVEYPKNIQLYGLSFNTAGPAGVAFQGEYSYRPNQPVQLPSAELLNAALGLSSSIAAANSFGYGDEVKGYRRVEMHQVQVTATKAFGPTLGAEQFVMVGEIGYTHLDLPSNLKFAANGCHLPQVGSNTGASFGSTDSSCFMTKDSWGYRIVGRMDFANAIGAATVSPRIAFSHDVDGRGPSFNEDAKALTFGVGFNYRQNWQADISYTSFFGGKKVKGTDPNPGLPTGQSATYASHTNPLVDRDFLSVNVSYSF